MLNSQLATATATPPIDFDKMLLEQALQAKTADAIEVLIRMAIQVEADHVADVLKQHKQQMETQKPPLPSGCVTTAHGVAIQCNGRRATQARRQLLNAGYTWRWTHLSSGANVKVWNPPDYESPAISATPIQWSSCSSGRC